jgi:hypothetical protein
MRRQTEPFASTTARTPPGRRTAVAAFLLTCAVAIAHASPAQNKPPQTRPDRRLQDRMDEARRKEGEALVNLADAAMSGRAASDFAIGWSNDFFKAQAGTFVPFTLTLDATKLTAASALMYVRAARRNAPAASGRGVSVRYPFDIIFPVDLSGTAGQPLRITRGFAVPPGDYDVYVALRERAANPLDSAARLKAAVLKQPLSVPDFWTDELTTSTIMLADRIEPVPESSAPDDVLERPYVIGPNEIHRTLEATFRRDRELIVVFLIYNPAVTPEKNFDIQVDYQFFRKVSGEPADGTANPQARRGEQYVSRTDSQRFTPPLMGVRFDPSAGQPLLAGQGILLSSFQEGEYRLGITVTDLMSRKSLSRDVTFTVVGS